MKTKIFGISVFILVILICYTFLFHHTEPTQVGLAWNLVSGEQILMPKAGWNISSPWVLVAKIDTRPMRVCITSSGRGFHCKLVQFESSAFKEFLTVEGFHYYWWNNRISFNFGYNEEYRGLRDIMRGHAFGIRKYMFISVLEDQVSP